MKTLAIIPARGGSKGIPGKNILPLAGIPLINWTINAASQAKGITRCIVSSDDMEIIKVAEQNGADIPFVRPASLATDSSSSVDVALHALSWLEERGESYDTVLLLQPTVPLRTGRDIENALELFWERKAPACVSVCKTFSHPFWEYTVSEDFCLHSLLGEQNFHRQDLPEIYLRNGAIYVSSVKSLVAQKTFLLPETVAYIMPQERSVNIDNMLDFYMVETLVAKGVQDNQEK